jgi:hypothetical protein
MTRNSRHVPSLFRATVLGYALLAIGWGSTGHRIINTEAARHLPASMMVFIQDSTLFGQHGSDADNRKSTDTAEAPKHYIDLESFANYSALTPNLDSVIAAYGWAAVKRNGILPWATVRAYDSLVSQLQRGDWSKATLTAADLGHYVGDGHQPLHVTVNYDGQLTGNNGIHSRFESGMINLYGSEITVTPEQVSSPENRFNFVLSYCIAVNRYADSILAADTEAKIISGWNGTNPVPTAYYDALWSRTQRLTKELFQHATIALASLWYSAWMDAGLISPEKVEWPRQTIPATLSLANYPNPFNPTTVVSYQLPALSGVEGPAVSDVRLVVYDLLGREVATLVNEKKPAGSYTVRFDASSLASGVYLCRLQLGRFTDTRKLVLLR